MLYRVTAGNSLAVEIEAPNWFMALGEAVRTVSVSPEVMERWVCTPRPGGGMHVSDPVTGAAWVVMPLRGEDALPRTVDLGEPPVQFVPPRPTPGAVALPEPDIEPLYTEETVPVQIFEWSRALSGKPPNEACGLALKLALRFIPAQAGSVLRGTLNELSLTIVAASGPIARELRGQKVPLGTGLAGLCYDMAIPIQLRDASQDSRHFRKFDDDFGFDTRSMLCVPVMDDDRVYGVLQLLNAPRPFDQDDVDIAAAIANTLAGVLAPAK